MSGQPLAAFQNQAEAGNFDPVRLYAFYRKDARRKQANGWMLPFAFHVTKGKLHE
jgi:hypothetical protein